MPIPVISLEGNSTDNTSDTSGTATLPVGTIASGDLLIHVAGGRDNVVYSGESAGWNEFIDVNSPANDGALGGWWRRADGTESGGTFTYVTSAATKHPGHTKVITGAADPTVTPPEASTSSANAGSSDPPSHTASWTAGEDNFVMQAMARKAGGTITGQTSVPSTPTNTFTSASSGGGGTCAVYGGAFLDASRDTVDPGATTYDNSNDWSAATIFVRAAAAGGGLTLQDVGGVLSFAGGMTRQMNKVLIGSLDLSGSIVKAIQTSMEGTLTFVGDASTLLVFVVDVGGTLTFAGTVNKGIFLNVDGGLSFTGDIAKEIQKNLEGTLTFEGSIAKLVAKQVSGELSFTGNLITSFLFSQAVIGTLSFVGGIATLFTPAGAGPTLRRMWRSLWSRVWKDPNAQDEDT